MAAAFLIHDMRVFGSGGNVNTWRLCRFTSPRLHLAPIEFKQGFQCEATAPNRECRSFIESVLIWLRFSFVILVSRDFGNDTMFSFFSQFHITLLSKQTCGSICSNSSWCGAPSLLLQNVSFGDGGTVEGECATKHLTLECLICDLRLPHWGFVFGFSFFPVTHTKTTNILLNFPTQKHWGHEPNQSRGTRMLAYCRFGSNVMTGWSSAHCQLYAVLQLSAICSSFSVVIVQLMLTQNGTGCVNADSSHIQP